jgi:prepilin-type N-terminal cleavage/methylation domain-containing protein/prepilin-type processing-associated H-X9-DG protein
MQRANCIPGFSRGGVNSLRRPGFTLLELLVVMAIIGILASLTYAGVMHAIQQAQSVQSSSNLRQLTMANMAYAADHGTFCPAGDRQNARRWHGARGGPTGKFDATKGFLSPYLGREQRVIGCPVLARMLKKQGKTFEEGSGGYGYNSCYLGGMRESQFDEQGIYIPIPFLRVARPVDTVMFATTAYARAGGVQEYPFAEPPFWDFGDGPTQSRPSPSVHFRFDGQAIVGWCDGHVSFVRRELRATGENPHGGDATAQSLGWFGPDENNGFWNPERN